VGEPSDIGVLQGGIVKTSPTRDHLKLAVYSSVVMPGVILKCVQLVWAVLSLSRVAKCPFD